MKIKAKKLHPDAIIPRHFLPGDAGLDFHSVEDVVIKPAERHAVATGISLELPPGYVALIWDKSGLAFKKGIKTMGGVIEHTYRGEYKIIVINLGEEDFVIKKGDKIAQMLIQPIMTVEVEEVQELSDSIRNTHGFGGADEALNKGTLQAHD